MMAMVGAMRANGFTHPRYTDMVQFDSDLDALLDSFLRYEPPVRLAVSPGAEMSRPVLP